MNYITIYPFRNKYRAEVKFNGIRKTKVHSTEADAKKWAVLTEREFILNHSTETAISKGIVITFAEALRRYSNEVSMYKKTAKKEMQRIEYYKNNFPDVDYPIQNYTSEHLAAWRDEVMNRSIRPLSAGSVLRDFSTLSAFFSWCIDKKWIKINPMDSVKRPKKPQHRERRIELSEVNEMLKAFKYTPQQVPSTKMQEVALIWLIALATGMRSGEIVNRKLTEIDLKKAIAVLPDTKNGTKRVVPLDNFAVYLWSLALRIDRKKSDRVFTVSDGSRDTLFRKARKIAGLEHADLTFHDSRHEAASLMAKRLKNPLTLCKVFGWKDPKFALVYYNPTHEEIVNELNGSGGLDQVFKKIA